MYSKLLENESFMKLLRLGRKMAAGVVGLMGMEYYIIICQRYCCLRTLSLLRKINVYTKQKIIPFYGKDIGYGRYNENNPLGYRHPSERYRGGLLNKKTQLEVLLSYFSMRMLAVIENSKQCYFKDLGTRLDYFSYYHRIVGCNILAVGYRGYGNSTGSPNEAGIQKDALAIMNYAFNRKDIDKSRIYLHGRSLGEQGAVATYAQVYSGYKAKGIILENTFTSMIDMVRKVAPILYPLVPLVLRNKWQTNKIIGQILEPIHFIRCMYICPIMFKATHDELVPDSQMKKLITLAVKSKQTSSFVIQNGRHNDNWTLDHPSYFNDIKNFIN